MCRKLLPSLSLALITAVLLIVSQTDADANRHNHRTPGYQPHYAPPPAFYPSQYRSLPPGIQKQVHRKGLPPGHQKKLHGYRHDDRRYHYDRRSYDRSRDNYGVVIRSGPGGTSVGIEYHKRR